MQLEEYQDFKRVEAWNFKNVVLKFVFSPKVLADFFLFIYEFFEVIKPGKKSTDLGWISPLDLLGVGQHPQNYFACFK
jgi:hypothetical protein